MAHFLKGIDFCRDMSQYQFSRHFATDLMAQLAGNCDIFLPARLR